MNNGDMFGWRSNPFSFKILPNIFVGYNNELHIINTKLKGDEKFSLLIGPTGSGKTTMLRHIADEMNYKHVIYLPKPPKKSEEWLTVFNDIVGKSRFSFFSRKKVNLYNLSEHMNNKLHDEKCFIFIDESHEASIESLEWLRSITDQTENLYILLAGLPTLEKMLKENLQSFLQRIGTRIELSNLTKAETKELIKRRIENSGGNNTDPFTSEAIDFIYRKTGGFPREVLRLCNDLSLKAHEKHISTIDSDLIKEMKEPAKRVSLETVKELPERQQMILDILSSKGELTPPEIVKNMKSSEYKNKGNALRAVNNLLKRLMNDGFVERKRRGKTYKYLVSEKFQSLMVDT